MNTAASAKAVPSVITIERVDLSSSVFTVTSPTSLEIKAGTIVIVDGMRHAFEASTPVDVEGLISGVDYAVAIDISGTPVAFPASTNVIAEGLAFGGFHCAPGSNATARTGGDAVPAINPFSCWDVGFRPVCPDPRGMALVDGRFWADIYLLGATHLETGTSRYDVTIADGRDLPQAVDGNGKVRKLDYATAVEIYAHHGKQLLGAEEFFAAAYGVSERASRDGEPSKTAELNNGAARFTSKWGLFDATGTMWQWGTDGDPDAPRASVFGGSWLRGDDAGSRCANLAYWPEYSSGSIGARGRSDHLTPVT